MNVLIVYSSRTGNTKAIAEAIAEVCPQKPTLCAVQDAPAGADDYEFVAVGYWVDKGMPDSKTLNYLKTLSGKKMGFFGTLGAYPDSDHARSCMRIAEELVESNDVYGHFLCQGKIDPRVLEAMTTHASVHHPMTEERKARIDEAKKHPHKGDFAQAQTVFSKIFTQFANQAI